MTPVSPVMPGSGPIEIVLGANQPEYIPLPVVYLDISCCPMISRWRLDDEERAKIAAGGDIILQQLTWRGGFQPVNLQVALGHESPELLDEVIA